VFSHRDAFELALTAQPRARYQEMVEQQEQRGQSELDREYSVRDAA
jgi:hypothetical protein